MIYVSFSHHPVFLRNSVLFPAAEALFCCILFTLSVFLFLAFSSSHPAPYNLPAPEGATHHFNLEANSFAAACKVIA